MEEPVGAQLAVHIALHTLKDRCRTLQQRCSALEEENLNLRVQCGKNEPLEASLSEIDKLNAQATEMAEQKQQLINKMRMVTNENQELWRKLSRLSHVNQNLGTQLNKINDSLVQYSTKNKEHSPLIRSKTFTQDEPQTKALQKNLEENGKICQELEEISLKIINSFAQGKSELDSLYSDITDMQYNDNIITDSCGFYYEDYDNNIVENFNNILDELKATKEVVNSQKFALKLVFDKLSSLLELKKKKICDNKVFKGGDMVDKSTDTLDEPPVKHSPQKGVSPAETSLDTNNMICPICCKTFTPDLGFQALQQHVENHFTDEP